MQNSLRVLKSVDWALMHTQKMQIFTTLAHKTISLPPAAKDALEGILNFLDAISDAAVADSIVDENVIFPPNNEDEETESLLN